MYAANMNRWFLKSCWDTIDAPEDTRVKRGDAIAYEFHGFACDVQRRSSQASERWFTMSCV